MSHSVITVENLGKLYRIRHQQQGGQRYKALRDVLADGTKSVARRLWSLTKKRKAESQKQKWVEDFWALKDVSFEVKQGETLGIIGRNGAGKSTLLKILSRITEPTEGRVRIKGRVASLLEVGTGFHPELTGRENIFLNGAILGMSRVEIRNKFEEIVAFAEVEKFLDTPVKRYSSGMYVRLAFAVAAHLDPEVLIVDEVLAVGDAEFQKKCLGKMSRLSSKEGRTVLFVSHNIEAVLKLCSRGILMNKGQVLAAAETNTIVAQYLKTTRISRPTVDLQKKSRPSNPPRKAWIVAAIASGQSKTWSFAFKEHLSIDLQVVAIEAFENIELGIGVFSSRGFEIASWTSTCSQVNLPLKAGLNTLRAEYMNLDFLPGQYYLGIGLRSDRVLQDYLPEAVWFEVLVSDVSAQANTHTFGGVLVPEVQATVQD